jgi:hypothetical protein
MSCTAQYLWLHDVLLPLVLTEALHIYFNDEGVWNIFPCRPRRKASVSNDEKQEPERIAVNSQGSVSSDSELIDL